MAKYGKWERCSGGFHRKVSSQPFGFLRERWEKVTLSDMLELWQQERVLRALNRENEPNLKLDARVQGIGPYNFSGPYHFSVEELQAEIERRTKEPELDVWRIGHEYFTTSVAPTIAVKGRRPKKARKKK